ncbi:hypothetical protein F5Y13DRAFT_187568 [Hypoxylon sp. FL1857]|nr:hypothetical protein F5Y13DRAFT_187568 [Hypoxylon sp. FL1857]
MAPLNLKSDSPTTAAEPALPAYDEGSAAAAAGEHTPFIRPEDLDVEAQMPQAQPPAYEAEEEQSGATNSFESQSLPVKILSGMLGLLLFAVGFGGILTLGVVFLKLLVALWHWLGLV